MRIQRRKLPVSLALGTLRRHVPGSFVGCATKASGEQLTPRWFRVIPRSTAFPSSETAYDQGRSIMTAISLLNSDRQGATIMIPASTKAYNGTDYTYYGPADCEIVENADGTVDLQSSPCVTTSSSPTARRSPSTTSSSPCTSSATPPMMVTPTLYAVPIQGMAAYRAV